MPKINRARIINFSYNNNNRHILDETFDFYGGENALLNLKNGGGKSVLVQTLFQPVLPKIRLMGRRIEDFFKVKKTPSFIMLEWALEDKGGYLLTGIGMARRESRTVEEGEGGIDLKYFTFTVKYREANEFDIKNIPLAKRNRKGIEIMDFKEARTLLDSKKQSDKFEITVYGEDDRQDYREALMSYGISQEEWRSVILNINQTEGGVIEIFDKSKTSQQLLNDWILKTIEKVMNGEEDKDNKKLGQMLENVVNDIINNEKFIRDKEIMEAFMKKSEEIVEELNKVEECRNREKNKKDDIAELFYFADKNRNSYEEEKLQNESRIEKLRAEIEKIELEEISKEYYDSKEGLEKLEAELQNLNIKINELEEILNKLDYEEKLERASQEYINIAKLQELLVSVKVDIERLTEECDDKKRIEALEYTLKIKYEKLLENLNKNIENIRLDKENHQNKINLNKDEKETANKNLRLKDKEFNDVKRDISDFIKYEESIKKSLRLSYDRNILSEIEKGYLDKALKDFDTKLLNIRNEILSIEGIIIDKIEEKLSLQDEFTLLSEADKKYAVELSTVTNKLNDYYQAEETIKPILERHNINWDLRLNIEDNKRLLEHKINEKDDELKKHNKQLNTITESLECIKTGSFNLPKRLIDYLKKEGIQYITGENYLRGLNKADRERLLNINPLLPYSFVMTAEQIEALKEVYFDFPVNQMIPLIDYKDLEKQKENSGTIVSLQDGISFLCIYDSNIVDFESLSSYEESLKKDEAMLREDIAHKEEIIREYGRDLHVLEDFSFKESYSLELEENRLNIEKAIEKVKKDIELNRKNIDSIEQSLKNLSNSKNDFEKAEKKAAEEIEELKEFIEEDRIYGENLEKERVLSREVKSLEEGLKNIEKETSNLQELLRDLSSREGEIKNDIKTTRLKYEPYKDKKASDIVEGDINLLEKELTTLQGKLSSDLERLRGDEERYNNEINTKNKAILDFDIPFEIYSEHSYDEDNLKKVLLEKEKNNVYLKEMNDKKISINTKKAVQENNLQRSEEKLKEKNDQPIAKDEILLNFKQRKQNALGESSSLTSKNREISNLISKLIILLEKIKDAVDIAYYDFKGSYKEVKGLTEDFEEFKKELISIRKEGQKYKAAVKNKLSVAFFDYKNKHEIINNIYDGINPLVEKLDTNEDNYYFLGERMLMNIESLKNIIRACELRLEGVENSKRDLIQHCYYHGVRVFDEIEKIAENSSIRLEGHSRSIPMLKIDMEPLSEEKESKEKIRLYIEDCISQISKDIKAEVKYEEIQKKMSRFMSTKELLNELSELSKAKVFAYKIDININNRGYKTWEQVMKENSGGERFVGFFTVLVALMSYTRLNGKSPDDYRRNKDTKVLIMDNPFGPISSEHLLRPLFQIAKKYNTQLICLTDLKQNSILNCFDLIYMIKIRTNIMGTSEFLELEKQLQPDKDLKMDESLEKAVFRVEDVEQISFL